MEIVCTGCNASYHLSEDRIPLETMTGTCKKCGTKIVIRGKNDTDSTTEETADTNQPIEDEETKQCPYCAETIKKCAKICRFCQINLITGQPFRIQQNDKDSIQPHEIKARSGVVDGVKLGCGMFIVLPIIIIILIVIFGALFSSPD